MTSRTELARVPFPGGGVSPGQQTLRWRCADGTDRRSPRRRSAAKTRPHLTERNHDARPE